MAALSLRVRWRTFGSAKRYNVYYKRADEANFIKANAQPIHDNINGNSYDIPNEVAPNTEYEVYVSESINNVDVSGKFIGPLGTNVSIKKITVKTPTHSDFIPSNTIAGTSNVFATLRGKGALIGFAAGTSNQSLTFGVNSNKIGNSFGTASLSGVLTGKGSIQTTITNIASLNGLLRGTGRLQGSSTGVAAGSLTSGATSNPNLGVVLNWCGTFMPDRIFADAARHGGWLPNSGVSVELGADGWPTTDAQLAVIFDDNGIVGDITGVYHSQFLGTSVLSLVHGGGTITNQVHDSGTNITTFDLTVFAGANIVINFASPVKNVQIMRPGLPLDDGTAAKRFNPAWLSAVSYAACLRTLAMNGPAFEIAAGSSLNGVNGNYDVYWSLADAVADGVPAWQANHAYAHGALVTNHSHVYWARIAGTSATSGSGPVGAGNFGAGAEVIDGGVHWTIANRIRPTETAYAFRGLPWEDFILLSNQRGKPVWLNIPPFVSDLYLTKMAQAFRFGTDTSGEPYTSVQVSPVWPPLAAGIPVYLEHGNEKWNDAYNISQEIELTRAAAEAASDFHHTGLTSQGNTEDWSRRWRDECFHTVRVSLLWRAVWGDSNMMTIVRPVYAGQMDYGLGGADGTGSGGTPVSVSQPSNTFTSIYQVRQYLELAWGSTGPTTIGGYTNPKQPVSYYIYAIAPAPYLDNVDVGGGPVTLSDGSSGNVDLLFSMLNAGLDIRKRQIDYWKHHAHAMGIKCAFYEWGTEIGTSFQAVTTAAWADTRLRTLLRTMGEYLLNAIPPAGYTYGSDIVAVANMTNSIGDGTFGILQHTDDPRSGQRWLAMQDLAAE